MTYGQVKQAVLRLLNASTVAGREIPLSYNDQEDLVLAMPSLVDDAVMHIAAGVKKIPAAVRLGELEHRSADGCEVYTLPDDCWQLMNGGLLLPETGERCGDFRLVGRRLLLPRRRDGLWCEYWRYPASVGERPDDEAPLDNSPETHTAVPYFVAAQLVMYDDAFRYAALHNEWEARLARLKGPVFTERTQLRDVYGGFLGL